jgi:hypothetical protein
VLKPFFRKGMAKIYFELFENSLRGQGQNSHAWLAVLSRRLPIAFRQLPEAMGT